MIWILLNWVEISSWYIMAARNDKPVLPDQLHAVAIACSIHGYTLALAGG